MGCLFNSHRYLNEEKRSLFQSASFPDLVERDATLFAPSDLCGLLSNFLLQYSEFNIYKKLNHLF